MNLDPRYKNAVIYKLTLPDDKYYIGATSCKLRDRLIRHRNECKYRKWDIYNHIRDNKIPPKSIKLEEIVKFPCGNKRWLDYAEMLFITSSLKNDKDKCLNKVSPFKPRKFYDLH